MIDCRQTTEQLTHAARGLLIDGLKIDPSSVFAVHDEHVPSLVYVFSGENIGFGSGCWMLEVVGNDHEEDATETGIFLVVVLYGCLELNRHFVGDADELRTLLVTNGLL